MRIAEDPDGRVLGAMVITGTPQPYVPVAAEPELYVNLLLVSRRHSGEGIGAGLIECAKQEAAERARAFAPDLVCPVEAARPGRERLMLQVAYACGLRISELVGLSLGGVDLPDFDVIPQVQAEARVRAYRLPKAW